jgi:hypothetical protein
MNTWISENQNTIIIACQSEPGRYANLSTIIREATFFIIIPGDKLVVEASYDAGHNGYTRLTGDAARQLAYWLDPEKYPLEREA